MNGSEHYREGERLLSDASFVAVAGHPVKRDGSLFQPGEHEALIARANSHFAAAKAAATALCAVLPLVGGDCTEITEWARAIGALDDGTGRDDVVEAEILPEHWPPITGDLWESRNGDRWFARRGANGIRMVSCTDVDPWDNGPPDFCPPDELIKAVPSLTLLNREKPPF